MARPKLDPSLKKVKLNLTLSADAKEMLDAIREDKQQSVSEWIESLIRKEHKRLVKANKAPEPEIAGQQKLVLNSADKRSTAEIDAAIDEGFKALEKPVKMKGSY